MYSNYYSELYHYGVPGMQKGRRRWTNPDGTLNAAGKQRYGEGKVGLGYTQARVAANKQRNSMNSQAALRSGGNTFTNSHKNRLNTAKSMNSQAALRMAPVSSSYAKDDKRTRANMTRRSMASQYELGSAKDRKRIENRIQNRQAQESSMDRQSMNEFEKARRNYESAGTKTSMRSQANTASARDKKRIDSKRTNIKNQLTSMNSQANIQRKKAAEAGMRGESAGITKQKQKYAAEAGMIGKSAGITKQKQKYAAEAGMRGESAGITKQKQKNAEARRIKIQKDKEFRAQDRERLAREQLKRERESIINAQNEINIEKRKRARRR